MGTRNCADTTYAEVNNAVNGVAGGGGTWTGNPATDGDIINLPAGSSTWTSTLTITKNISLIGSGDGITNITENLTRTGAPGLISISLSKETAAPGYSFRLSGFKFLSDASIVTDMATDNAFVRINGFTLGSDSPAPYVRGCVSRVRFDHITFFKMKGLSFKPNNILGVMDHCVIDNGTRSSAPTKVNNTSWTPDLNPATGLPLPSGYTAADAFGGWGDDAYYGTDKFFFFEDCSWVVGASAGGQPDDEQGARCVYRHCTFNNSGGVASHGMEGRKQPGVRAREIYNNYYITTKAVAQERSGSVLWFNNRTTGIFNGIPLKEYRAQANYNMWGAASGDNRYDQNPVGVNPVVTGLITGVQAPGSATTDWVTVAESLSGINLADGSMYVIVDLDDPFTVVHTGFPGWQYRQSGIDSITGQQLNLNTGTSPDSAHWQVGHHYEIRRVLLGYCGLGSGKGNLLNAGFATSGYADTWNYPATSGTLAVAPQAGYPREPCYSWNNTDDAHGYLDLSVEPWNQSGRDYFKLTERTIETQQVGYPPVNYTRATSDWPNIGPSQSESYAPFTYPHPLQTVGGGSSGPVISLGGDMTFENVIIGETKAQTLSIANNGDADLHVTNITLPTGFTLTGTTSFTVVAGAHADRTITFTPLLEQLYSGNIVVTSDASSGTGSIACSGTGVAPVGGGGGHGKGHKKGVLSRRV